MQHPRLDPDRAWDRPPLDAARRTSPPLKILMQSYEFPPLGGGGAKVVDGLSAELVRLGHRVDVVTMGYRDLPRVEVVNGVRIHRVPCLRLKESICTPPEMLTYCVTALFTTLRLMYRERYDVYHPHFIFPDGLVSLALRLLTGCRYVVTAHGSDVPNYNPDRFKLLHKLLTPVWRIAVRGAECIVCPSETLAEKVTAASSRARTAWIPNGFEVGRFRPDRPKQNRILVVSRMFERKGVQYLIEALAGLRLDHEVHIVGDGPYLPTLRELARRSSTEIKFWGWLENDSAELRELYETSQLFVFTSAEENFPIVLLEAMAAGMAIITTSGTGCAEVVGDTGRLVAAKDPEAIRRALLELTGDPKLCRRLGRDARRRIDDNFTWRSVAERHLDLYRDRLLRHTAKTTTKIEANPS